MNTVTLKILDPRFRGDDGCLGKNLRHPRESGGPTIRDPEFCAERGLAKLIHLKQARSNYGIRANATFTPNPTNTTPIARSNQCPMRENPARTRSWLNNHATMQNHVAVAAAR